MFLSIEYDWPGAGSTPLPLVAHLPMSTRSNFNESKAELLFADPSLGAAQSNIHHCIIMRFNRRMMSHFVKAGLRYTP